ncbi:Mini-ribonuclease 3 [Gloeobacter violaceus]|uniref:Mini-ribonuclease 3 n=1 Tax=Gloeobacter violaceus (strain ATCC 29082 / PCC 7421) TaxID=251221 RepID=MRNC_GLOVI|nr:ribonuclease III domain-containing protein [Gloeobacter violaceus]Q7NDQ2.2 RecName: Full=Mini-ribonuclease 3; Short=Mini-3; Short=Mini-RNase 3; AltName: Full=Mini-RNase III; Short=Mini-III [Gloeobacter violaceus PCC 7421]
MDPVQIRSLSLEALAYLGDAVWELHVRTRVLLPPRRLQWLHGDTVACVRASAQAKLATCLSPHLTVEEADWLRRGRNAGGTVPRRLDPATYRLATAFEALLGYLFLADRDRLGVILHLCDEFQHHHGPDTPSPEA